MDTLGFGSHLIVDGFRGDPGQLARREAAASLLESLAKELEPESELVLSYDEAEDDSAYSLGCVLAESTLLIHIFPARREVVLDLFTRRPLDLTLVHDLMEQYIRVGRYESYLGNRSKLWINEPASLKKRLRGDRHYAEVRLDPELLAL